MTEKNLKRFQEDLEQLNIDIALGKLIRVVLFGGPLDGASRLVQADNGTPMRTTTYFVVPNVIKIGVPVDHARYEWSVCKQVFVYANNVVSKILDITNKNS